MAQTTWEPTATWGDPTVSARGDAVAPPDRSAWIAGRYQVLDPLGSGGFGTVFRALDQLRGEEVAVKLCRAESTWDLDALRREVTALRWLRLPGVAAFVDDGLVGEEYFIVTELVRGTPFPGRSVSEWADLEPVALDLLEILARVHLAGVLHLDLKPANVLVDADGRPVVLDFGLARGRAVTAVARRASLEGTPRYIAPEVVLGSPRDARADLWSLGLMLWEALAGEAPQEDSRVDVLLARRTLEPIPSLARVAPGTPPHVVDVVDRMLALIPHQRPASALEVIQALGGRVAAPVSGALPDDLPADRLLSEAELRALFRGPDGFLHLQTDGARLLWERTAGHPERVAADLAAWMRTGWAHWDGDEVVVDRRGLEALVDLVVVAPPEPHEDGLPPGAAEVLRWTRLAFPHADAGTLARVSGASEMGVRLILDALRTRALVWDLDDGRVGSWPRMDESPDPDARRVRHASLAQAFPPTSEARLRHMVLSNASADEVVAEARVVAADQMCRGHVSHASEVLRLGLDLVQHQGDPAQELALLQDQAVLALCQEAVEPVDRALYALGRSRCTPSDATRLADLLRGARAIFDWRAEWAAAHLERVPPFKEEALEVWRQGLRMTAAREISPEEGERVLAELRPWAEAGPSARTTRLAGWEGNLRYAQNRFEEAAQLQLQALASRTSSLGRLSTGLNAAMALLETGRLDACIQRSREARERARVLRHARYEARATRLERAAEYRGSGLHDSRPELVEAASAVSTGDEAQFALREAAFAWRARNHHVARRLAERASLKFGGAGMRAQCLLAQALLLAAGGPGDAARIAAEAGPCEIPDLKVQILGLLALSSAEADTAWEGDARAAARFRPRSQWAGRLDVISYEEALAALRSRYPTSPPHEGE